MLTTMTETTMPIYAIGIVVVGFASLIPVVTWLMSIGNRIGQAEIKAATAAKDAEIARERSHDVANQLSAAKVEFSQTYVRQSALDRLEERLMEAITEMRGSIEKILSNRQQH